MALLPDGFELDEGGEDDDKKKKKGKDGGGGGKTPRCMRSRSTLVPRAHLRPPCAAGHVHGHVHGRKRARTEVRACCS